MSKFLYMGVNVSFAEKNIWIYGVLAVVIPAVYAVIVLGQVGSTPVEEIEYVIPLITAIAAAIVLAIIGNIIVAIASPKGAGINDERDRGISRTGELVGYYSLSAGVLVALGLVMAEAPHFWVAQTIYAAFILSAILSTIIKIVAYRRAA
ncbi:hypothetical protein EYE40_01790 [Glaciihabitans arcticus]|uniref:DUF2178 domain-containing protein n=1 Tax=Glaciihabitans arcticus TaxID=2668039 RepID=A0A4Q9GT05_9MICO|nr:hypothetical protein [Glaciihabitans arcticus]TBN56227.1 hypothetical protein EYE40_01790 [Glaciihabitans arcticus]